MSKIRPSDLDERLSGDEAFVLDIRPRSNYQNARIEGSYNAPVYGDLQRGDTDALDAHLDAVPEDEQVVVVCKAGIVAKRATSHLQANGYDAVTLSGGYRGWRHYDENTLLYRVSSFLRGLVS